MRKEVKRSLLLWPAAASAAVTAVSWMGLNLPAINSTVSAMTQIQRPITLAATKVSGCRTAIKCWTTDLQKPKLQTPEDAFWTMPLPPARRASDMLASNFASFGSDASDLGASLGISNTQAFPMASLPSLVIGQSDVSDRDEHGARGVPLPERVASVFGQDVFGKGDRLPLMAPVRTSQHELAGLAKELKAAASSLQSDINFNRAGLAEGTCIVSDSPLNRRTLQSLRNRTRVLTVPPIVEDEVVVDDDAIVMIMASPNNSLDPNEFVLKPSVRKSSLPESNRILAKPARIEKPVLETLSTSDDDPTQSYATDLPQIKTYAHSSAKKPAAVAKHSTQTWPAGWPVTSQLDSQLAALIDSTNDPSIAVWSRQVSEQMLELRTLPRLGDERAGAVLEQLTSLTRTGEVAAEQLQDREDQVAWLRAVHALDRRVQVWNPIWQITRENQPTWMVSDQTNSSETASIDDVIAAIASVRGELPKTGDEAGWSSYLLLDEIESAAISNSREIAKREERSLVAQRLLSRLSWHALQEVHLGWLDRESVRQLSSTIRPWARGAVDYADLLAQIERQESDAIDMAAIEIADAVQTLRFADNPASVKISNSLGAYYRNANVRMAISQDMLNRMLPSIDPKSVPLNTTMLGTRIRGTSYIDSDLAISLSPSRDRWSLQLQTNGNVSTNSTGINGPVAIRTRGTSRFAAATPIEVTRDGIQTGNVSVDVQGGTRLSGVRSEYDSWPLVGSLVRAIAETRYDQSSPISNRIASNKIKIEVGSEVQTRLNEQVGSATEKLSTLVLGPLGKLHLDPQVIDMQTTNNRLLARYRLAGDWQLAAFTPRPRAPQSNLLSLQVHQSAINNTLEQLVPRDEPMEISQVVNRAANLFGQTIAMPADMPEGVTIQFARTRPITVEVEEGKLWVTMRIVRLNQGSRVDLTQFIVRASYVPQINGLEASLVRDGHLRISGPGMSMRERLPVRAIFNKVLAQSRPLPLTLPALTQHPSTKGLAVSQLELRGGWIAIALSEEDAPRIALQNQQTR
ncbi:hypothetical protein [Rubripirellula reticaptiva]|uniref:Uncharacterized protein n=1 Tax=Rubripirellula reticaptiva TaxID=2528013 RepID=A0A5C6ERG7_9BACT|nr:hypothetical protein [Rubripirellula reticaptiva]TWU51632.1 hypothetical protein Poly59_32260 [Rubripirellula reticaptiva]